MPISTRTAIWVRPAKSRIPVADSLPTPRCMERVTGLLWDCGDRDPPGPAHVSSHAYEIATSNEILDMQRFNKLHA